jgi:hypothetical protein
MEIPIACTLEATAARQRVDQWRELLSGAVTHAERVAPGRLSCELNGDLADLRALALLAREEKACCGFFNFSFQVEVDAVTMVVAVPDDAASILDQFATLMGPA